MDQIQIANLDRDIRRMRAKRLILFKKEDVTAEDWGALADEYETLEFTANAANCRRRADQLRELSSNGP